MWLAISDMLRGARNVARLQVAEDAGARHKRRPVTIGHSHLSLLWFPLPELALCRR